MVPGEKATVESWGWQKLGRKSAELHQLDAFAESLYARQDALSNGLFTAMAEMPAKPDG